MNLQLLSKLFQKRGFACDKATDGLEALALVKKDGHGSYDIVFMDANMPNMVRDQSRPHPQGQFPPSVIISQIYLFINL